MTNPADETVMPLQGTSADGIMTSARKGILPLRTSCKFVFFNLPTRIGNDVSTRRKALTRAPFRLRDTDFRIGAEHLPQGFADFTDGGVSANRVHDIGHGVGGGNVAFHSGFG